MLLKLSRRDFFMSGLACVAATRSTALGADLGNVDLSFIQVSDTHVSTQRLYSERRAFDVPAEESVRRCRAMVTAVNKCTLPYDLVVHTGDVAHTRDTTDDYDLARELIQLERTNYFLPGNHDVGYSTTHEYRPAFEERFGKTNVAIEPAEGLRFVLFDSQPLDNRCGEEDREWAFGQLDRLLTPAKPTILFCHVMGLPSYHVNRVWRGWPQSTMNRWTARMKEGGVRAVMAGHFHRDELHYVDGIPFHLCGPVVNMWDRQTCFRHWSIEGGRLSYRTVYLEL
jgi:3',5'-cyclic AMP phosphodiesterase CpdA